MLLYLISLVERDMLRLSVNLLTNTIKLLREVESYSKTSICEPGVYFNVFSVNPDSIVEIVDTCGWIKRTEKQAELTSRGKDILNGGSTGLSKESIRMMLEDYMSSVRPIWRSRIPYGRSEACIFMSKDEKACFHEAGLLDAPPSQDVINWWDDVAESIRTEKEFSNLEIGRKGEKLTVEYETKRTLSTPRWIAIESNKLGYDILSRVSEQDDTRILIEVKTTEEPIGEALFHVSKNEWKVASTSVYYYFYIWSIESVNKARLAILTPEILARHIPIEQESGEWESIKIPYREFVDYFNIITAE